MIDRADIIVAPPNNPNLVYFFTTIATLISNALENKFPEHLQRQHKPDRDGILQVITPILYGMPFKDM